MPRTYAVIKWPVFKSVKIIKTASCLLLCTKFTLVKPLPSPTKRHHIGLSQRPVAIPVEILKILIGYSFRHTESY